MQLLFPREKKHKVWQMHMVASPLSSSRKPLLCREATMGAQTPAPRGEASGIRQDPLSRCCSWKVQMFYIHITGRMKNKNLFLWKYFFPLTENRNICISFCPEISLYIFSSTLKCINLKSQKKGCGSVEIKTSSSKNLLTF